VISRFQYLPALQHVDPVRVQGPTRRARGEAFFHYITTTLAAKHNAIIVPDCGHNDRCIFTTAIVLAVIFPQ